MLNVYLKILTGFIVAILALNSCVSEFDDYDEKTPMDFLLSNDSSTEDNAKQANDMMLVNDDAEMQISAYTEKWEDKLIPLTKTTWTTTQNTVRWVAGDKVGIYQRLTSGVAHPDIDRNNYQYTVTTGNVASSPLSTTTPLYFPHTTTDLVSFYAYYPYAWVSTPRNTSTSAIQFANAAAVNSTTLNYQLTADQSTQATISNSDIMCASVSSTNRLAPNVSLNFNHKMTLLTFRIKTTIATRTLTRVALTGTKVTSTGTLNLLTSALTPNTSTTFSPFVTLNTSISPSVTATVDIIINPTTIVSNGSSTELKVSLTVNGSVRNTNLITSGSFVAGSRHVYNITLIP